MAKNKIIISIAGSESVILTDETREYTLELAGIVDTRIRALLQSGSKMTLPMAAILTCLELCDENEKNKVTLERMREEIRSYLEQTSALKAEQEILRKENHKMKIRLDKLEAEGYTQEELR